MDQLQRYLESHYPPKGKKKGFSLRGADHSSISTDANGVDTPLEDVDLDSDLDAEYEFVTADQAEEEPEVIFREEATGEPGKQVQRSPSTTQSRSDRQLPQQPSMRDDDDNASRGRMRLLTERIQRSCSLSDEWQPGPSSWRDVRRTGSPYPQSRSAQSAFAHHFGTVNMAPPPKPKKSRQPLPLPSMPGHNTSGESSTIRAQEPSTGNATQARQPIRSNVGFFQEARDLDGDLYHRWVDDKTNGNSIWHLGPPVGCAECMRRAR